VGEGSIDAADGGDGGGGGGGCVNCGEGVACARSGISAERLARVLALFGAAPRLLQYFGTYADWFPGRVLPGLLSGAPKSRDPWFSMRMGYLTVAAHDDGCPLRGAMNELLLDPAEVVEEDRTYNPNVSDASLQLCSRWPQALLQLEALGVSEGYGLRVAGGHEAARRRVLAEFVRSALARWNPLDPGDPSEMISYMEQQVARWRTLSHVWSHFFDACDAVLEGVFGMTTPGPKCEAFYGAIASDGTSMSEEHWGRMAQLFPLQETSRRRIDEMYLRLAQSADRAYGSGVTHAEEFRFMEKMDTLIAGVSGGDDRSRYLLATALVDHRFMVNYMRSRMSDGPRVPRESRRVRGLPPLPSVPPVPQPRPNPIVASAATVEGSTEASGVPVSEEGKRGEGGHA
jgi:hypothetical protein